MNTTSLNQDWLFIVERVTLPALGHRWRLTWSTSARRKDGRPFRFVDFADSATALLVQTYLSERPIRATLVHWTDPSKTEAVRG